MAYVRFIRASSFFDYRPRFAAPRNGFTRAAITLATLSSVVLFPWPFTALLALIAAAYEPLVPLAAGIFADALYFAPLSGALPVFTLYGALATLLAYFVRSRLSAGVLR